jgi:hypothetical protein
VNAVLAAIRRGRSAFQQSLVIKQGTPLEVLAATAFVEERGANSPSYMDFMLNLHKAAQKM